MVGEEYVHAMMASESDRDARAAFQRLVLGIAAPRAALFDFGAGPGVDAKLYAEHGYSVDAYDNDPGMREYFSVHCRDLIEAGRVTSCAGTYSEFLANDDLRSVDLVTCNFAPLNHVTDLHQLFAKFHVFTRPGGLVLASVLNPFCASDLKYRWWWRNVVELWRKGQFSVQGTYGPIFRRRLPYFTASAAPYFKLKHVLPGSTRALVPVADVADVLEARRSYSPLHWTRSRYLFLLFQRSDTADSASIGPNSPQ